MISIHSHSPKARFVGLWSHVKAICCPMRSQNLAGGIETRGPSKLTKQASFVER